MKVFLSPEEQFQVSSVASGDEVFILDYSGTVDFACALAARARAVTVLDHHRTALVAFGDVARQLPANLVVELDMLRSGASIALDYFARRLTQERRESLPSPPAALAVPAAASDASAPTSAAAPTASPSGAQAEANGEASPRGGGAAAPASAAGSEAAAAAAPQGGEASPSASSSPPSGSPTSAAAAAAPAPPSSSSSAPPPAASASASAPAAPAAPAAPTTAAGDEASAAVAGMDEEEVVAAASASETGSRASKRRRKRSAAAKAAAAAGKGGPGSGGGGGGGGGKGQSPAPPAAPASAPKKVPASGGQASPSPSASSGYAVLLGDSAEGGKLLRLVRLIEDGDLYRWWLRDSREFNAGIGNLRLNYDVRTNSGLFASLRGLDHEKLIASGRSALEGEGRKIDEEIGRAFILKVPEVDIRCLAVRTSWPELRSALGHALAERSRDQGLAALGVVAYSTLELERKGYMKVSVRAVDGGDTLRLTEKFGGGGHQAASSCNVLKFVFDSWCEEPEA